MVFVVAKEIVEEKVMEILQDPDSQLVVVVVVVVEEEQSVVEEKVMEILQDPDSQLVVVVVVVEEEQPPQQQQQPIDYLGPEVSPSPSPQQSPSQPQKPQIQLPGYLVTEVVQSYPHLQQSPSQPLPQQQAIIIIPQQLIPPQRPNMEATPMSQFALGNEMGNIDNVGATTLSEKELQDLLQNGSNDDKIFAILNSKSASGDLGAYADYIPSKFIKMLPNHPNIQRQYLSN